MQDMIEFHLYRNWFLVRDFAEIFFLTLLSKTQTKSPRHFSLKCISLNIFNIKLQNYQPNQIQVQKRFSRSHSIKIWLNWMGLKIRRANYAPFDNLPGLMLPLRLQGSLPRNPIFTINQIIVKTVQLPK